MNDSTTSSAVIEAPAAVIAAVISATGCAEGGPSTRIVIAYPGLVDAITQLHIDDRQHRPIQERCSPSHLISHQGQL